MRKLGLLTAAAVLATALGFNGTAKADPIAIENPSFESDILSEGGLGPATGWTGGDGSYYPSLGGFPGPNAFCEENDPIQEFVDGTPDGNQIGWSNGSNISQDTAATITPGFRYTLRVFVGGRCGASGGTRGLGNHPYTVQILGDGAPLASTSASTRPTHGPK